MKLRILGTISLLAASSVWIIGCPGNSPTSPAAPTATPTFTDTPCMNASGTPCTSTPTFTVTDTATATDTGTPTSTATSTYTKTATATATATDTQCTNAQGTPCTSTPTLADTSTFTPTYTDTGTPTQTYTPTPDCTGTYSISGSLTYNGSNVSGDNLVVLGATNLGGGSCSPAQQALSTGNGTYSYTLNYLPAGSYYLIGLYGQFGSNGPSLGTYAGAYDGGSGDTCNVFGSTKVTVSSGSPSVTRINLTFDGTYQIWGVNANVAYTGSQSGGSANAAIYSDSGYTTQIQNNSVQSGNSGLVSLDDPTSVCNSGGTVYVMAWFGQNNSGPQSGDAYVKYGSTTEVNNTTSTITVSFGDTNIWP